MTEHDPTAIDPDEYSEKELDEIEEQGKDVEFLPADKAAADDTVDDAEGEEQPHDPSTLDIAPD